MNKLITVSPSPHNQGSDSVKKLMYAVILAMVPAMLTAFYFFGLGAIIVTLTSVASCVLFEYLIVKFMLKSNKYTIKDGSAIVTGILLAFNLPGNLPIHIIIIGAFVAIAVGKMSFGGLGNNPFNPALVGRVFLLISFPVEMNTWPKPEALNMAYTDAITGPTSLSMIKEGLNNGEKYSELIHKISYLDAFTGAEAGSLGEISALAIILGGIFLIIRKVITWHIPVSILVSIAIVSGIQYFVAPDSYIDPLFHLLTGGIMLGAVFMATDYATSPMSKKGMLLYGTLIGILTILIRVYGAYPEGISFAILIMNAFVPLINKYMRPKRFGEVIKK